MQVSLNVARSEDEAERQARGEDVTVVKEEALQLETFNPDALFEEEALARQRGEGEQREVERSRQAREATHVRRVGCDREPSDAVDDRLRAAVGVTSRSRRP